MEDPYDKQTNNADSTNTEAQEKVASQQKNESVPEIRYSKEQIQKEIALNFETLAAEPLPISFIPDGQFPFYGCAVCNISYIQLKELDRHVATHKNRVTSWDLRVKAVEKKRKLKKEKKRLKKEKALALKNLKNTEDTNSENATIDFESVTQIYVDGANEITESNDQNLKHCDSGSQHSDNGSQNSEIGSQNSESGNQNSENGNDTTNNGNDNLKHDTVIDIDSSVVDINKNDSEPSAENNLEKIFKCAGCFKQFSLSYYLKLHVRSHTGEKPYQCAECGLAFITASKLGRHKRMHSMAKHQCRICHKLFSRFDTLMKHFDKKHMEEKLEGEPYDYNAILPYLKELEEELSRKNEGGDQIGDEAKPLKEEDSRVNFDTTIKVENVEVKVEKEEFPQNFALGTTFSDNNQFIDSKNFNEKDKINDSSEFNENDRFNDDDSFNRDSSPDRDNDASFNESIKKEDTSDNDSYFPIEAWTTPAIELKEEPEPPPKRRKRSTKSQNKISDMKQLTLSEAEEDDPLRCKICKKHIKTPTYMRIHLRTHTGERPFKCYICQKGFITSSKMHRHVLTHVDESIDETKKEGSLDMAVKLEPYWEKDDDAEEIKTETSTAKRKTRKRNAISKQLADTILSNVPKPIKTPKVRPYACDFCNKKFLHVETLQVHRKCHKDEDRVISCHFCLTTFETNEDLNVHLVSHTGTNPYLCTLCGKTYKRKETMVYHRKMHKMEKKYQCDVCSKTFMAPCKLQRHLMSHRPDKYVIRYECPVCAHIFNTKYHIEMHLTTHEKDGMILKENRGEILAMVLQNARKIPIQSDTPLTSMKDLIPADERSRICNICGEIFHHFYYLEEHLKTHGSKLGSENMSELKKSKLEDLERRYKCPVCNKGFKLHYYLKLHSFTHTKEKPFMCQRCGKGFITKGKLKRHLESHAGLKKYQCHICYKFFTRPSYLRIHVKTIHGKTKEGYSMPLSSAYIGHSIV